ncbi:MAG: MurR/RpiR family transcriptional regulator [Thomasclavelia sp.]|nr:MurR/RpiR family transcriptional regulator [Thomasclavelia sp.]
MDFLENINLKKNTLTKNENKACELICSDLQRMQQYSLTQMSDEIKISKTTILRFCQKIGYSGYSEFRYDCIKYVNSLHNAEKNGKEDQEYGKIKNVETIYNNTIKLMHYTLDDKKMVQLVKMIKSARIVRAVGEVNSSVSALQLKYALAMYGINCNVLSSSTDVKAIDLCANKDDLIVLFSASGKSEVVKETMNLKENVGCKIVLITMANDKELEEKVDNYLLLPPVATLKNKSLLDSIPIFSVFIEILLYYIND